MSDVDTSVGKITKSWQGYSIRDASTSLFVSSLWLPNISAVLQHLFLVGVFTSMKPEDFQKEDQIVSYDDYRSFFELIYGSLPSFVSLEDMIPEPDWGHVKYYYENELYRIFYGTEISNVVDHLAQFHIIHGVFDEEYQKESNRSPDEELRICLQLQDHILSNIKTQIPPADLQKFSPGHTEVPPKVFWEEFSSFGVTVERVVFWSLLCAALPVYFATNTFPRQWWLVSLLYVVPFLVFIKFPHVPSVTLLTLLFCLAVSLCARHHAMKHRTEAAKKMSQD